jgi:hypothetical protein
MCFTVFSVFLYVRFVLPRGGRGLQENSTGSLRGRALRENVNGSFRSPPERAVNNIKATTGAGGRTGS